MGEEGGLDQSTSQSQVLQTTDRVTSGSGYRNLAILVAAVAVLVSGLAMLGRFGSEADSSQDPLDLAQNPSQPRETLPGFFTTTTSEMPASAERAARSPASDPSEPNSSEPDRTTLVPGQYLLGEPTGLWLFYGGIDPLQRIDLDNGEHIQYGLEAFPLAATGGSIVLYQQESAAVGWVPAAEPAQQALSWKRGPIGTISPDDPSGKLWILDRNTDMEHPSGAAVGFGRWELIDLASNRILDRRPGDLHDEVEAVYDAVRPIGGRLDVLRPGPELSTRPDGVYRYSEAGYQLLADGHLLAQSDNLALVADCVAPQVGDPDECRYRWFDTTTVEIVELPVPQRSVVFVEILAEGQWLHTVNGDGQSALIELGTGDRLEYQRAIEPAVSPDGRWLALLADDMVTLIDLDRRGDPDYQATQYRGLSQVEGGDLLFVSR